MSPPTPPLWRGFYAPPGVPDGVVGFWADVFTRVTRTKTRANILEETGWFPFLLTGDEFTRFLDTDTRRYAATLVPQRA